MKVRLLVSRGGPGVSQSPGDVIDVSGDEAERMIAAQQCVAVNTPTTATKKRGAKKARTAMRKPDAEKR